MDRPDDGRDDEGNKPKEVEGHDGSGGIGCAGVPALGTNRDDNKDENNGFDASVISSSPSEYSNHPVERGGRGGGRDMSND